jgi:thioesterase domain-containing protein/acyl carrier protein
VRYLPDGNIEFLGRIDQQVKIRGFRVELGEIEVALSQHPGVREAVVLCRVDTPGNKRLVAYVVPGQTTPWLTPGTLAATGSELRGFLKEKLPDYMIPSAFVSIEALPLTPNGKVDREALSPPEHTDLEMRNGRVAPRDSLELLLATIWEKVLGIKSISATDDFFELGGHSLLAVQLFAEIEKAAGKRLPLATLFQAPTIEQLADVLRREGWNAPWPALVPIQPSGSNPPFFCFHAAGGNVLNYRDLAHYLGADQPVYGVQARGLNGEEEPLTRLEDMAAYYIEEMRELQPEGPYFLGGASFGGNVAFEVAQQLQAQGQTVALVALFDTGALGYQKLLPITASSHHAAARFMYRVRFHAGNLLHGPERLQYISRKAWVVRHRMMRRVRQIIFTLDQKLKHPLPKALINVKDASYLAARNYLPQVYPSRVVLFRAKDGLVKSSLDPLLGWKDLAAGGVEVREVPGDHLSILTEPYVRDLSDQLSDCLRTARDTA